MKYLTITNQETECISVVSYDETEWPNVATFMCEIGLNPEEVDWMVTDEKPQYAEYDQSEILASLED